MDHPIIYLVDCGEYSDYDIVAAFLARHEAEAFVDRIGAHGGLGIRPIAIGLPDQYRGDLICFDVVSDRPPEVTRVFACSHSDAGTLSQVSRCDNFLLPRGNLRNLTVTVKAMDCVHATKIAADKFREFLASEPPTNQPAQTQTPTS